MTVSRLIGNEWPESAFVLVEEATGRLQANSVADGEGGKFLAAVAVVDGLEAIKAIGHALSQSGGRLVLQMRYMDAAELKRTVLDAGLRAALVFEDGRTERVVWASRTL